MSRSDPGAATGTGVYPPQRWCVCGQLETLHILSDGKRRGCPHSHCKRFEPGPAPDPSRCGVCGAQMSVFEQMRKGSS